MHDSAGNATRNAAHGAGLHGLAARALLDILPDREREAVMLAAEGYTNAEIASRMFISERTAKTHLSSAADKLNMGRVQMARLVERADLPARL